MALRNRDPVIRRQGDRLTIRLPARPRLASSPRPPEDKPSRLSVEQTKTSTRLTLHPAPWPMAVWPMALSLAVGIALVASHIYHDRTDSSAAISILGVDAVYFLAPLLPLAGLAVTITLRTRHLFEADGDGLLVESLSPLRRSMRRWPAAEIDGLFVETRTARSTKSMSATTRSLMLQLANGKRKPLPGYPSQQNIDWICQVLNIRLRSSRTSSKRIEADRGPG